MVKGGLRPWQGLGNRVDYYNQQGRTVLVVTASATFRNSQWTGTAEVMLYNETPLVNFTQTVPSNYVWNRLARKRS